MTSNYLFVFLLLNLRGALLFSSIRILNGTIGRSASIVLSFVISVYTYPAVIYPHVLERPIFSISFEILLGLSLGVIFSLLFEVFPFVGRMLDTFRGVQFQEQVAPEMGVRDSRLEIYAGYFVLFIFFQPKIFSEIITLFSLCTEYLGIGGFNGEKYSEISSFFENRVMIIQFVSTIFYSCFLLVFPLIVFGLIIEIGFSLMMKINSKISLGLDLGSIRAFSGLLIVPWVLVTDPNWTTPFIQIVKEVSRFLYLSISKQGG